MKFCFSKKTPTVYYITKEQQQQKKKKIKNQLKLVNMRLLSFCNILLFSVVVLLFVILYQSLCFYVFYSTPGPAGECGEQGPQGPQGPKGGTYTSMLSCELGADFCKLAVIDRTKKNKENPQLTWIRDKQC